MPKLSNFSMWSIMSAVFLMVIIGGVLIAPVFVKTPAGQGIVGALLQKPFNNSEDIGNALQTFGMAMIGALVFGIVVGGFLRWILKRPIRIAIRVAVSACVFLILSVTLVSIFTAAWGILSTELTILAFALALALTAIQYFYPEWYVIDLIAVLVGIGVAALLGASLGILPAVILMILFSIYDFSAVILSKFMKNLAQGSADLRLPSMLVIPYDLKESYRDSGLNLNLKEKNFLILGTGDLIFPAILPISVYLRTQNLFLLAAITFGILWAYTVMFVMIKYYPNKFRLLPGLPFLCGGAIISMLIFNLVTVG